MAPSNQLVSDGETELIEVVKPEVVHEGDLRGETPEEPDRRIHEAPEPETEAPDREIHEAPDREIHEAPEPEVETHEAPDREIHEAPEPEDS